VQSNGLSNRCAPDFLQCVGADVLMSIINAMDGWRAGDIGDQMSNVVQPCGQLQRLACASISGKLPTLPRVLNLIDGLARILLLSQRGIERQDGGWVQGEIPNECCGTPMAFSKAF